MALIVGAILALAIGLFATGAGLDRDRAFYPVVTIVVAAYYVLFAVMGGSHHALLLETLAGLVFVAAAVAGFKGSVLFVMLALAGLGIFDLTHSALISNPGVPAWWPAFCGAYVVTAAGYLAWRLKRGGIRAVAA